MMPRYDVYKDSGVEWIGEIPEHWDYKKITHCFNLIGSGTTPSSTTSEYYENGKINWLQTGDLTDGIITRTSKLITQKAFDDLNLKIYPSNSLIIAMYGATIGKVGLLKIDTTTNQACCVLADPKGVYVNYAFYWFIANKDRVVSLGYGGGQPNISQETIKSLRIHCPPTTEQTQIVTYLDKKTSLIDELISLKERKIELLKEKRIALINHVVTKGLDPNVKMKDSGIEWIGEIPEHWEVKKMKYAVFHSTEKALPPTDAIKISPENVESNTGKCLNYRSEYEGEGYSFTKGDLLLNKLRIYLKKILFAELDGFSMGEMLVLRCKSTLYNRYFYYLLFNQGLIDFLDAQSTGIKMPRVSPEIILNTRIIYPPKSEQTQIVKYLDKKTKKIDNQLTLEQKKIDLLKEYRQSLISEVVTGKIKVTKD